MMSATKDKKSQLKTVSMALMTNKVKIRMAVHLVTDVAIMMSFGILFPPLLCIVALSIIIEIYAWRALLGQWKLAIDFESNSDIKQEMKLILDLLGKDIEGLQLAIISGFTMSIVVSTWFWSFSLFDILGDSVGGHNASWIAATMIVCPVLMLSLQKWFNRGIDIQKNDDFGVEISPLHE
jgi:hypothetical protein